MSPNPSEPSRAGDDPAREELLAQYIDRLNAGEAVDADQIRRDHPDCADDLVELLKEFEGFGRSGEDVGLTDAFGDYRIIGEIGRGGMGVVYEALDPSMDRRVALKVLSAGLMVDKKSVERFRREARAVGKLSHPNIVAVYATGVQRDTPYIAMEFVEGESLEKVLERKQVSSSNERSSRKPSSSDVTRAVRDGSRDVTEAVRPPAPGADASAREESWSPIPSSPENFDLSYCIKMAGIFAETAEALEHAHSRGIVHRDLKPSNLILTPDHKLRILDFGLARVEGQEQLTLSGEILGTPRYMSPEQVRALGAIDHRTDIYSLGATLYEVLTLTPPIGGRNAQDTLIQIVSRDPPSPRRWNPRIPRDLETIVLKCLRKDPRDRYQTASELLGDLRHFTRGDPILARPQSLGERIVRTVQRHRVKLVAAAAFSVLLAIAIHLGIRSARDAGNLRETRNNLRETRYEDVMRDSVSKLLTGGALAEHVGGFAWRQSGMDADRLAAGMEFESELISQAETALREAIAAIPGRPDGHFHLARCLIARGKTEKAMAELDRAVELGFVPAMVLYARLLDTRGDSERATALREQARGSEGADWVESWIEGKLALKNKRWEEAASKFGELIELLKEGRQPYLGSAVEVYLLCGLAQLQAENYRQARSCFTAASALRQSAEPEIFLGFTDYAEKNIAGAEKTFEKIYARYADHEAVQGEIIGLIVSIYWARFQDIPRAMKWAERMAPGFQRELWRASCLGMLGRPDEALEAANELVRLKPDVGMSHYLAAVANMTAGRFKEAEELAIDACKLLPTSSAPYSVLAWSLARQERFIESTIFLHKAIRVEPEAAAPHYFLAKSYVARNDFASAEKHMKKAIESSLGSSGSFFELADAHHSLAKTLEALGKPEEALEHFRAAAQKSLDANFGFNLNWLRDLAMRELAAGRRRETLRLLEQGLDHPMLATQLVASLEREIAQHARALRPSLPSLRAVDLALADLDHDELVGIAGVWRFHRGHDAPSPGGEWTEPDFDDGDWDEGPGPFGYGQGRHATVLTDMKDGYTSVYLRAVFERPDDPGPFVQRMLLSVTADDGFVAYLNGTEVARVRAPAEPRFLAHSGRATARVRTAPPTTQLEIDRGTLVAGRNVLALHGLNVVLRSSDFTLAARLTLEWKPDPDRRLARTREYLDTFRNETPSDALNGIRQYLEGRVFQLEGDPAKAAELFSEVLERFPAHALPSISFHESYRATGELAEGVQALRECLETNCPGSLPVLGAWAAASLVELEKSPAELVASMPCRDTWVVPFDPFSRLPPDPAGEVLWVLGQLDAGRPIRINCGGSEVEVTAEEVFSGDRLYVTGKTLRRNAEEFSIANTDRAGLYVGARLFSRTVFSAPGYLIPLTTGRYRVALHFAEIQFTVPGHRRFDVLLEDKVVLEDYDPGSGGVATADVKRFEIDVEDGLLEIVFRHRLYDPVISAIEIIAVDG